MAKVMKIDNTVIVLSKIVYALSYWYDEDDPTKGGYLDITMDYENDERFEFEDAREADKLLEELEKSLAGG